MKILVLNGPNLNMLGIREPDIYGKKTYYDLVEFCEETCNKLNIDVEVFQSNHEGEMVDIIQEAYENFDAIVLNAAAYTHTSVAILDALKAVSLPTVEVHLSDIDSREEFRKNSVIRPACEKVICGRGFDGYREAIEYLNDKY